MVGKSLSYLVLLGCAVVFAFAAQGAGVVGNGGDVVMCGSEPPRLLDYFEGEGSGATIDLGGDTLDLNQKVQLVISRISRFDQKLAEELKTSAENFSAELTFEDEVPSIDDAGSVSIPPGCSLEQLAAQFDPRFNGDIRYVVDRQMWDTLSLDDQAGLILHELLFRIGLSMGVPDSKGVRKFNIEISSTTFANYNQERYQALVADTGLDRLKSVVGFSAQVFASPIKVGQDFYWLTNNAETAHDIRPCGIARLKHGRQVPTYVYPQVSGCKRNQYVSNAVLFVEGEYLYFVAGVGGASSGRTGTAIRRLHVETLESEVVFQVGWSEQYILGEVLKSGDDYFFRVRDSNKGVTDLVKVNSHNPDAVTALATNLEAWESGRLELSGEFLLVKDGRKILRVPKDGTTPAVEVVSDPMLMNFAVHDGRIYGLFSYAHEYDNRGGIKVIPVEGGELKPLSLGHKRLSFVDVVGNDLIWISTLPELRSVLNVYKLDGSGVHSQRVLKSYRCGINNNNYRIFSDEESYYWSAMEGLSSPNCGYIIKLNK